MGNKIKPSGDECIKRECDEKMTRVNRVLFEGQSLLLQISVVANRDGFLVHDITRRRHRVIVRPPHSSRRRIRRRDGGYRLINWNLGWMWLTRSCFRRLLRNIAPPSSSTTAAEDIPHDLDLSGSQKVVSVFLR